MVQPLLIAATLEWVAAGVPQSKILLLDPIEVRIADLQDDYLGMAFAHTIWIDVNAGGYGWFVDVTPFDDREFPSTPESPANGKVDLLTVLTHEIGHLLGFEHGRGGPVMDDVLPLGVRRHPQIHGQRGAPNGPGAPAPIDVPPSPAYLSGAGSTPSANGIVTVASNYNVHLLHLPSLAENPFFSVQWSALPYFLSDTVFAATSSLAVLTSSTTLDIVTAPQAFSPQALDDAYRDFLNAQPMNLIPTLLTDADNGLSSLMTIGKPSRRKFGMNDENESI